MTQQDLSPTDHIIFFSKDEWDQGYKYCNEIYNAFTYKFPDHHFIGIPDTTIVKDMDQDTIKEIIGILESYLEDEQSGTIHTENIVEE